MINCPNKIKVLNTIKWYKKKKKETCGEIDDITVT